MRLVSLICPNCSSPVEANEKLTKCTCNYCGTTFLIDDEAQKVRVSFDDMKKAGFDFERGRYDAENTGADEELVEKVSAQLTALEELEGLTEQERILNAKLIGKRQEVDRKRSSIGKINYTIPIILSLFVLMIVFSADASFLGFLFAAAFVAGSFILTKKRYIANSERTKSELSSLEAAISREEQVLNDVRLEKSNVQDKIDLNFIPAKYQSKRALRAILNVLKDRRALTISQAINIYEGDEHRKRLEDMQREQLDLQKKQAERINQQAIGNAAANLGAGVLAAGVTVVASKVLKNIVRRL